MGNKKAVEKQLTLYSLLHEFRYSNLSYPKVLLALKDYIHR